MCFFTLFFFTSTSPTWIYTLSLHDALPIYADYFDFERIEALKPAIEACGISTLSQSPIAGLRASIQIGRAVSAGMPRPTSYAVFCLKKKKQALARWLYPQARILKHISQAQS